MPEYAYRAKTRQGSVTKGRIKAPSVDRAAAMLADHGLVPLELQDVRELSFFRREVSLSRVRVRDRAVMARQFATMIEAGIPILQALRILVVQTENAKLSGILREISYDVEGGASLSEALEKHPKVFSEFFVSMVRSGEVSGRVAHALTELADHEERDYELVRKVRGALIYPAFVLTAMIVLGVVVMVFIVPQVSELFKEAKVALPLLTRLLIGLSAFLRSYWWFVLIFFGLAGYLFASYTRTPEGTYTMSALLLRLPLFGTLMVKAYLARFTGVLQTLVESEVPVIRALLISRDVLGNRVYQTIIERTADEVKNGSTISAALEKYPEIPLMVSQMVSVGERSGQLGSSLGAVQRFYRREVDEMIQNFSTLIEPIVIVLLGIGVGLLITAVLMPMYQLVQVIA